MTDMQTVLDKFSLRALVTLRLIANFQKENGRSPKQYDLGTGVQFVEALNMGIKSDPRALFQIEWERLGIEAVYPHGFCHLVQFHLAVKTLRKCGLMVRENKKRMAYALTERGFALAAQLTDDWRSWSNLDAFCEQSPREIAKRHALSAMQRSVLNWACAQKIWDYDAMRERFPYANYGTIRGLIDKGLVRRIDDGYTITSEGVERAKRAKRA
jgi:predicted transcriptional regulator